MMCVQIKKIKSFCRRFVIVTGHALALPPLLFCCNTLLCVYHKPGCKRFLCSYVNENCLHDVALLQHVAFMQHGYVVALVQQR